MKVDLINIHTDLEYDFETYCEFEKNTSTGIKVNGLKIRCLIFLHYFLWNC